MNTEQPSNPYWTNRTDEWKSKRWHFEKSSKSRKGEYIGSIIMNLIGLYIITHITKWDVECIKDNFGVVQWALVLNCWIQIGGNAVMLIFEYKFVRRLSRAFLEAASFFTILLLYTFFPFDFSVYPHWHFLNSLLPIVFIIAMIVSAIKVFSNLWKLIF